MKGKLSKEDEVGVPVDDSVCAEITSKCNTVVVRRLVTLNTLTILKSSLAALMLIAQMSHS